MKNLVVDVKVALTNNIKFCLKCNQAYESHDIISLCPECRLAEANYRL